MRKVILTVGALLLMVVNWIYVALNATHLNLLTFLLMVVFLPAIYYSVGIAGYFQGKKQIESKKWLLLIAGLSGIYTIVVYILQLKLGISIESIINNTNTFVNQTDSISISNIEYSNGASSYIMIFLMVMVFIVGFSILLKKISRC